MDNQKNEHKPNRTTLQENLTTDKNQVRLM